MKNHLLRTAGILAGGAVAAGVFALAQTAPLAATPGPAPVTNLDTQLISKQPDAGISALSPAVQTLLEFRDKDVKFKVERLMEILSDKRHEGWVLAAYPDPKTAQPLIGAGFSLDLPAREHLQRDPLNPHPFLEPSSAELWQAAGLPPTKLDQVLTEFRSRLDAWDKKGFRRQIWDLDPQITESDANALLRIGIIQAIDNAKAYCRNFDKLSASQQMAMTQLVYQMGVNLEQFSTFLNLVNQGGESPEEAAAVARADAAYWKSVQLSLVQSQWARLYRGRATAVIAMLDPQYAVNPTRAERNISRVLRPVRVRHSRGASLHRASLSKRHGAAHRRRSAKVRKD